MGNHRGQTLVELAIVLPCFCLGVFMAVQLMCYCHNMIELQRMAQVTVDSITYENYGTQKKYTLFNSLWGRYISPPRSRFGSQMPTPWRPFHGMSTIKEPGRLFTVRVGSVLKPGNGFSSVLSSVSQQAFAETYLETPLSKED